jgi:hypothetical protein
MKMELLLSTIVQIFVVMIKIQKIVMMVVIVESFTIEWIKVLISLVLRVKKNSFWSQQR